MTMAGSSGAAPSKELPLFGRGLLYALVLSLQLVAAMIISPVPTHGLVTVGIVMSFVVILTVVLTAPIWREALGFGAFHSLLPAVLLWTAPTAAVQVIQALLLTEGRFRPFAVVGTIAAVGGQIVGLVLRLAAVGGYLPWFSWFFDRARRWSNDSPLEGSKRDARAARHGSATGKGVPE